jgi:hypothetical protein
MASDPGLFNFQGIMDDFYGYSPDKDDDEGRALKRGFQADMVKKAADQQFAMAQAAQSQQFGLDAMQLDADLTQRNARQLNQDAFTYGMQEMGAKFDYESRMAVDDAGRALNQMASAGDIQQNQTRLEGKENRLTLETSGGQDRETVQTKGTEDRASIVTQQLSQGDREIANIGASGVEDRAAIQVQGSENVKAIEAAADADIKRNVETVGADVSRAGGVQKGTVGGTEMERERQAGDMAIEQITGQGDQDVRKIESSGGQDRETMKQATRETAKDRANQRQYSRELAAR